MPRNRVTYTQNVKPYLNHLCDWYQNPDICTDEGVCAKLGISLSTFYKWQGEHTEFMDAVKKAKDRRIEKVVDSIYRRAFGFYVEETKKETGADNRNRKVGETVTRRYIPGDVTAQIFILKNKRSSEYRDRQEIEIPDDVCIRLLKEEESL